MTGRSGALSSTRAETATGAPDAPGPKNDFRPRPGAHHGMSQHAYHIQPALPDDFWNRIHSSPRRLLMLDYDGTLVPFHVQRMEALPSPETLRVLREILHDPGTYRAA